MNDEIVDLSSLRVHQHRAAIAADVIHRVRAGDEDRRRADDVLRPRCRNEFQRDARMFLVAHDALPVQTGVQALSVAEVWYVIGRRWNNPRSFHGRKSEQKGTPASASRA